MSLTLPQLLAYIDNNIKTNNNQEITGAIANSVLKAIAENTYPVPTQELSSGIPGWTSNDDVQTDTYWFFADKIWRAKQDSGPDSGGAVEPGSDPQFWDEISPSSLAHPQNTDIHLGRYIKYLTGTGTVVFVMFSAELITGNYFVLTSDTLNEHVNYSFNTFFHYQESRFQHEFYVIVANKPGSVTIETNQYQDVGPNPLVLESGDWAKFRGGVGNKAVLLATNVNYEASLKTITIDETAFTENERDIVAGDNNKFILIEAPHNSDLILNTTVVVDDFNCIIRLRYEGTLRIKGENLVPPMTLLLEANGDLILTGLNQTFGLIQKGGVWQII